MSQFNQDFPQDADPLEEVNWRISSNKRHLGLLKSTLTLPKVISLLLIYICNFHDLNHLLLIFICKLHWILKSTSTLPKALKQQYKKVKANLVGDTSRTVDDHLSSPDLGKSPGKYKPSRSGGSELKSDAFKDISNPISRSDSKESDLDEQRETKSNAGSYYGADGSQTEDRDERVPDMEEAKPVEQVNSF